jgi:hypothetical protein
MTVPMCHRYLPKPAADCVRDLVRLHGSSLSVSKRDALKRLLTKSVNKKLTPIEKRVVYYLTNSLNCVVRQYGEPGRKKRKPKATADVSITQEACADICTEPIDQDTSCIPNDTSAQPSEIYPLPGDVCAL